ncbi:MAG: murein hydrolase activator EnvC family protein [Catonella sp.]|uniref:murein hydrolase activator EnvC family protein n=1 Tax=Catonella sp. TaxID=2382125 RepID=UPI003FA0517E
MFKKKILALAVVFIFSIIFVKNISMPLADTISNQKAAKKKLEAEKARQEERVGELKEKRDKIENAIRDLDEKKQSIELKIADYSEKAEKTEEKIKKLEIEVKAAKKVEDEQYDIMKKRIRYMYENGESDYLDIILGSSSVEDLLNQGEYISKISDYDNTLLARYKQAKEYSKAKKAEKEKKLTELTAVLDELKEQKLENERLAEAKNVQIEEFAALIKEAGKKVSKYELEIVKKEKYIDRLIAEAERAERERRAREAAREAARRAQAAKMTDNSFVAGKASSSGMIWPMPSSRYISSGYGYRGVVMPGSGNFHYGIDIAVNAGAPIVAAKEGRVIAAAYNYSMGNHVIIDHGGGLYTVYMHASKLLVSVGQDVSQGQNIALVGSTGMSTGPHLHFGVKLNGQYVNPMNYVSP